MRKMKLVIVVLASLVMVGCANTPIGSGDYSVNQARTPGTVVNGTVTDIRSVRVQEDSRAGQRGTIGAIAGAAAGAAVGNQVSDGATRRIAQTAAAAAGSAIGSRADQRMAQQQGLELQVELEDGRQVVVTQGVDQSFGVGQPVRLIRHGNTYRVTQ
ncbi:15 kDa peptidoglycan-associated lipoprotein (plasmid) [Thioalkalivibrio sp. K90mix]|uniref:outer membrane lipoprotein n=1 Tax=Thioalkalivibrio sp. (strain K90mix) TaxID=396595 RepID=UPI000195AB17|nr:hypothetical protein [Thioalkalivibrio sp. K90mix]ADC73095.1 15 kDa peptidoglycan-associated lipoprotein [Thioalkalivibrio sp. K90mix]ADC73372.1 15 kDa peptidoglycan-associated lipoprotein [Thioalkalivibrio sp. K90mix]